MNVILGVDLNSQWEAALDLFLGLRFPNPHVTAVHALENLVTYGMDPPIPASFGLSEQLRDKAERELERACSRMRNAGIKCDQSIIDDYPVRALIDAAEEHNADLIAIGSGRKGNLGSLFFGSTGRGLAIGSRKSVLIAKTAPVQASNLTAVLATDHSAYMRACLDRLLLLKPMGLGQIEVVTANEVSIEFASLILENNIAGFGKDVASWAAEHLNHKTAAICTALKPLSDNCHSRVVHAEPEIAIRETMLETKADVLIVGAQGHGYIERTLLGSTALYEAVIEPFNLLILRGDLQNGRGKVR